MTENERIKVVRLSQREDRTLEKFGARLGVSASAISQIETGKTRVTSQMRTAICNQFHIREEWLRDGTGEMEYSVVPDEDIAHFVGEVLRDDTSFRRRLISILSKLTPEQWDTLQEVADNLAQGEQKEKAGSDPE